MKTRIKESSIVVGEYIPDEIRCHLKKYLKSADYGYVSHLHNYSPGESAIERLFRNKEKDRTPVSELTLPALRDLIELALKRIDKQVKESKVSKKKLTEALA